MRFMILVKATDQSEAGEMPSQELLEQMQQYNEELVKAGVLLAGEGLHPSNKGARVRFSGDKRTVVDGPFTETKELVAGFWLFDVASKGRGASGVRRGWHRAGGLSCRGWRDEWSLTAEISKITKRKS